MYGKSGYYEYDFKVMPADILGAVYENYLGYKLEQSKKGSKAGKDAKKRKEHGIYYTPEFIVDYIVKNSVWPVLENCRTIDDLMQIRILDPACGSGSFLIKAVNAVYQRYYELGYRNSPTYLKLQIITQNIYGVDLDQQAVEIARLNLLVNAVDEKILLPSLAKNIKNGNSLMSGADEELKKYFGSNFRDKKPFNWQEEFPEVFKNGGFDITIGNPPYISFYSRESKLDIYKKDLDYLVGHYEFTNQYNDRRLNTVMFFIEKSLKILSSSGSLGFIVDANFLEKPSRSIRKFIEDNVGEITISNKITVFKGVSSDQVLIFLKKTDHKKSIKILSYNLKTNFFFDSNHNVDRERFRDDNFTIIEGDVINLNTGKYIDEIANIFTGVQIGIGGTREYKNTRIENLFYSDKKHPGFYENISLDSKSFFRYSPVLIKNFINLDDKLAGEINKKVAKCNIAVTKARRFKDLPKIFIRQSSDSLTATLGDLGQVSEYSAFVLTTSRGINIKYILALLNSRLLTYYARQNNIILSGGKKQPQIRLKSLKSLPIPSNLPSPVELSILINNVDKILDLNNKIASIVENSEKWQKTKEEIDRTDKKIDEEVYKLYGLTPDEIKIVEGEGGGFD